MGTKRIRLMKGDVFRIRMSGDDFCFMQYLANDINQLNGEVVRVFRKRYKAYEKPAVEDIVAGPVDFYTHVFVKNGIHEGFWEKYGYSKDLGNLRNVFFTTYHREFMGNDPFYYIWRVSSKDWVRGLRYDRIPSLFCNAYEGSYGPPSKIMMKIMTGTGSRIQSPDEDSLRSRLGRKLRPALSSLASEIGFTKAPDGDFYFMNINDDIVATLFFKCSSYQEKRFLLPSKRPVALSCSIGITSRQLCKTLIAHIGQLMPQGSYMEWDVTSAADIAALCSEIKRTLTAYAFPFMEECSDSGGFAKALTSDRYYRISLCLM